MPVQTPHSDYTAMMLRWKRCRDVIAGDDTVKAAGPTYLPRLDGMTPAEYDAYKCRALFFNGCARTAAALVGAVFSKDADVKLPDGEDARFVAFVEDVTNDGTPLNDFAMRVLDEVVKVGRYGVLVDMQSADTPDTQRRPYLVGFQAEDIVNWAIERVGGDYVLTRVVLKEYAPDPDGNDEFVSKQVEQYRVLRLEALPDGLGCTSTVYRRSPNGEMAAAAPAVLRRRGQLVPFIPFVFVNPGSTLSCIEKPPLLDMVDVNLSHYRTSADLEHALHFLGLPTPWVVGSTDKGPLPLGPSCVWRLEGQNAQAGLLEFTGQGLGELRQALDRKQEMMATLGARLIEQAQAKAETAESVKTRNAAAYATLRTMAGTVSQALTRSFRWLVWWADIGITDPNDGRVGVELNREFVNFDLTADELKSLLLAWQGGAMSFETFYFNLKRGGRAVPGVSVHEERALIDAQV